MKIPVPSCLYTGLPVSPSNSSKVYSPKMALLAELLISPPGLRRVNLEQQVPWSVVVVVELVDVVVVDGVVEVEVEVTVVEVEVEAEEVVVVSST